MEKTFYIPLKYKAGDYLAAELPKQGECLVIEQTKFDYLIYLLPVYGTEVRRYSVKTEDAEKTMRVRYNDEGDIVLVDVMSGKYRCPVYFNIADDDSAKAVIYHFCSLEGERLCESILERSAKVSRIFIEKFYDGESVDFSVKTASPEEVAAVRAVGGDSAADNSGEYSNEYRISCDCDTWGTMLVCCPPETRADMFGFGSFIMQRAIEENAIPKLNKAADFRFILNEYD
ncbi:hypothetical protein [Ruminococcus sp.]|uniref:hypothetical protein n=1 Tax=Ruminococcus sp. TaxID=41978 RepID=UPI001B0D5B54|nr:hypothetical protein [Ruminococcus sp.]MBO5557800.1 hypothetical protein [Ruminococcus sp.]